MDGTTIEQRRSLYNKLSKEELIDCLIECEDIYKNYSESLFLLMHWKTDI